MGLYDDLKTTIGTDRNHERVHLMNKYKFKMDDFTSTIKYLTGKNGNIDVNSSIYTELDEEIYDNIIPFLLKNSKIYIDANQDMVNYFTTEGISIKVNIDNQKHHYDVGNYVSSGYGGMYFGNELETRDFKEYNCKLADKGLRLTRINKNKDLIDIKLPYGDCTYISYENQEITIWFGDIKFLFIISNKQYLLMFLIILLPRIYEYIEKYQENLNQQDQGW